MLILGGTCGLLAGAAKCTGWFNDRCRALPDQDPFTALAGGELSELQSGGQKKG